MHSKLTNSVVAAHSSNYTQGRRGYNICKITPHHMAGVLTGAQCARIFQNANRNASSNYCIGNDGSIVCSVEEENRAWTSGNWLNDCQAITIEVSDSKTGGDWPISDKAWNALVDLCVDICQRHNFKLNYTGDKNGSLTRHNMFQNTNCPGPYLQSRFQELADTVNARLDGGSKPEPTPSTKSYTVKITANVLNVRKGPGINYGITTTVKKGEVYTIVKEQSGWGKLKSGAGWINLSYTNKKAEAEKPATSGKVLGLYTVTANGLNVRKGPGTNYGVIKIYKKGTRFDTYEIKGDWAKTPSGWVNLNYAELTKKY